MKNTFFSLFSMAFLLLTLVGCGPAKRNQQLQAAFSNAQKGQWQEALATIEKCQSAQQDNADALALNAIAIYKTAPTELAKALELADQAVTLAPERYDLAFLHGWLLLENNRPAEALEPLQKAYELHLTPQNAARVPEAVEGSIQFALWRCQMLNNQVDEALKFFEQAIKHTPYKDWPELYNDAAVLCLNNQRADQALKWITIAQKMAPKNLEIAINMAIVLDTMAQPSVNPKNYKVYQASYPSWYAYARSLLKQRYNSPEISMMEQKKLRLLEQQLLRRQTYRP